MSDKQIKDVDLDAPGSFEFDMRDLPGESGHDDADERPRLSCSGSGRITRAFTLRELRYIFPAR